MYLHEELELFNRLIDEISNEIGYKRSIIEKDYYVCLILEEISKDIPELIFKGGTSLSKAYKIIKRFSEDIDLTCNVKPTSGNRKRISHTIKNIIIENLKLKIVDIDTIRSKSDHNNYKVDYLHVENDNALKEYVQVETAYFMDSFPSENKKMSSYIYDYLKKNNREKIIKDYNLHEFEMQVQTIERTFIDKVFALCDYAIRNKTDKRARHIYDLYKIYPLIEFNDEFRSLVNDVRLVRRSHEKCESAQIGTDINEVLRKIKNEKIFKKDFETVTQNMLAFDENVTYEEAITVIDKIIESNLFVEKK